MKKNRKKFIGLSPSVIVHKLGWGGQARLARKLGISRAAVNGVIYRRHTSRRIQCAIARGIGICVLDVFGFRIRNGRPLKKFNR
jgi:DNA-binding transcriptional regulator YdaS (Cro superfamily)